MKRILFSLMTLAAVLIVAGTGSLAYFSDTETSTDNTFTAWVPIGVQIDIKPGSDTNPINPDDSQGVIPVAILTTADFDAYDVDGDTVRFGPWGAWAKDWKLEDVDDDGDLDMLLHFRTQHTGLIAGDTEAKLTGKTLDGTEIYGSDSVTTVPPEDDEAGSPEDDEEGNPEDDQVEHPEDEQRAED